MEATYSSEMLVSFHQNVVAPQRKVIWLGLCVSIGPRRNSQARTSVGWTCSNLNANLAKKCDEENTV
jgi:hypothetical protein